MSDANAQSPGARAPLSVAAAALSLACLLFTLDLLLGALIVGAHLDAVVTGPPQLLVGALGLAVYCALLLCTSLVIYGAAGMLRVDADQGRAWHVSLGVPVAALGVLLVGLGVGHESIPAWVGGYWVTASLTLAIAASVALLPRLRLTATRVPGRLMLYSLLSAVVVWTALDALGSFDLALGTRRARLLQIALACAWAAAFSIACLLRQARPLRLGIPASVRLLIMCALFCLVPALVIGTHGRSRQRQTDAPGPNLVLITFDAMRADRLALYGGRVPTPQFAALAADGVVFEQARSQAPTTVPSMLSLFASRFPSELASGEWGVSASYAIPDAATSLAEALREKGYATYAVAANYALGGHTGILQGFSDHVVMNHLARRRNVFSQELPALEALTHYVTKRPEHACLMDTSQVVLRHLRGFLRSHSRGPFFVWLHFMDPHDPYAPPDRHRPGLVRREGPWPVFAPHDASVGTPTFLTMRSGHDVLSPAEREYVSDLYDAEIAYADELLGQMRAAVAEASGRRPVIWCVSADHGEEFWEHGNCGHGQSLYDELVRVPLVIAAPDAHRGLRASHTVGLIDVMPTLWELCGLGVPEEHRGTSLADTIAGEARPSASPVFSERNAHYEPLEAVVVDGHKLVRGMLSDRLELFDLDTDPGEQHDRAAQQPETVDQLADLLAQWRSRLRPAGSPVSVESQQEQLDRLKALGYL